ncbi:MAG: class I lanthipeptide [Bacteroidales bacterium]|nr:class I lanthipeptide [Bacteroidales bacterium]
MKKKKFNKKLSLNKETVSNLDNIKGGNGEKCRITAPNSGCQPTENNQTICNAQITACYI